MLLEDRYTREKVLQEKAQNRKIIKIHLATTPVLKRHRRSLNQHDNVTQDIDRQLLQ